MGEREAVAIVVHEIGRDKYTQCAGSDPSYEVTFLLSVVPVDGGLGGLELVEEAPARSYRKGADSAEDSPSSCEVG